MSNKVPQLRFNGYSDAWVQRKLGDLGKTKSGIGFPDAQQGGTEGTPFYKVSDMNNPGNEVVMTNANNYVSESQLVDNKWKTINPENSGVVFAKVGAAIFLDRKRIVDNPFLIDNNMMSYLFDSSWDRYFGKTLFEKLRLAQFAQVGALPSFNGSDVANIKVTVPETSEQAMIGKLFQQLDNLIAANQRKLDLLKEQKKGYLQKMFPKNGAKVPELRFAGFADDWEERKLGDAVNISSGVTGDATLQDGKYRLTRIESISQGMLNVSKLGFTNEKPDQKHLLNLGDILYSNINSLSHIGKVALVDTTGIYHGINLLRFQMRNGVDSEFLFQRLNTMPMKNWAVSHANPAVSQASINQTELSKQPISSPTLTEQQQIGNFFKEIDNTIALHQRKLDFLKEQKKGLLQKMFV